MVTGLIGSPMALNLLIFSDHYGNSRCGTSISDNLPDTWREMDLAYMERLARVGHR
jgi:hypothetical protein